jgi:enterochelin esterase family protein
MPYVAARRTITTNPQRTVLVGQSLGGLAATHAGLHAPDRFGLILTQSGAFWWRGEPPETIDGATLIDAYRNTARQPVRFFQEAGLVEREILTTNRLLNEALRERGYDVVSREYSGGHDYACWRGGLADGLIALLGNQG